MLFHGSSAIESASFQRKARSNLKLITGKEHESSVKSEMLSQRYSFPIIRYDDFVESRPIEDDDSFCKWVRVTI